MSAADIAGAITYSLAFGFCLGIAALWFKPVKPEDGHDSLFVAPLLVAVPMLFGACYCVARLSGAAQ